VFTDIMFFLICIFVFALGCKLMLLLGFGVKRANVKVGKVCKLGKIMLEMQFVVFVCAIYPVCVNGFSHNVCRLFILGQR